MDSCTSALLLREMGYDPIGVRLVLHQGDDLNDQNRLKALRSMGIEVLEVDGRDVFHRAVIKPFLEDYESCRTPNPCVICNENAKLKLLFDEADRRGIDLVATGHYVKKAVYRERASLARASFVPKDQSYMLYRIPRRWIDRLIFPLGDMSKEQVRRYVAQEMGSPDMAQGDSQDICFIDGALDDFLLSSLGGSSSPGPMVSVDGEVLGRHRGLCLYTEGQRKGLGLGGGPWFVVKKDIKANSLILGRRENVEVRRIRASSPRWQQTVEVGASYDLQHRYRSRPQRGTLVSLDDLEMEVLLDYPAQGVALGQSLVFYDGDRVLGGGIIDWTANW